MAYIKFEIEESKIAPLREHLEKRLQSELEGTEWINDMNISKFGELFTFGHYKGLLDSHHVITLIRKLLRPDPEGEDVLPKGFWLVETYREMMRDALHVSNIPRNDYEKSQQKARLLLLDELEDYFELKKYSKEFA